MTPVKFGHWLQMLTPGAKKGREQLDREQSPEEPPGVEEKECASSPADVNHAPLGHW